MEKGTPTPDMTGYNKWRPCDRARVEAFGAIRRAVREARSFDITIEEATSIRQSIRAAIKSPKY